ncbi:hypothetical protein BCR41DRAFT_31338 [Lobosporangium transversale]|uniref:Crinkler effector protein N-terminal domain-containing protein n=1 Tax=Lobosporangium transversale TaxID=64571 RepID=A0A1Y2FXA8_9FUNG|nr:hypothetical protein BCR41DRAFT_31338 [Lobosporangium transversale]ORY88698.1 hypothetical protein BCR41DRAFT_31338 [Lobosporangium transversale]|eukprot:XP_021875008.1 hypothetical protein BCR41DRAFT_31338 [Lobosporangium transversale]
MTSNKVKLFCILDGDSSAFEVKLDADDSIAALKKAIKKEKEPEFDDIAADKLNLWLVSLPSAPKRQIALNNLTANEESRKKPEELEDSTCEISDVFGAAPPKKTIHIIVQRPLAVMARLIALFLFFLIKKKRGT